MTSLLTIAQACEELPSKPTQRWLNDFLRKTKVDRDGRPLYRVACRAKLIYMDRLIEALPCPSNSFRPAKEKVRIIRSADRTSGSLWIRAAELTNDRSLVRSSRTLNGPLSGVNTHQSKLRVVTGGERS